MAGTIAPIVWPLRAKLSVPLAAQQHARSLGGNLSAQRPVNLPWNVVRSQLARTDIPSSYPSVVHQLLPIQATRLIITGVTKDSTGAILVSCAVALFRTVDDVFMARVTSDAVTGVYVFPPMGQQGYYTVEYKDGATPVFGSSVNTLTGVPG